MADLTSPAPNWAAIGSFLVGLGGLTLAFISFRRAARSQELAERAERRAVTADDRAEEAHTILRERFASDKEREQAKLDAPGLAEIWAAQVVHGRARRADDGGNLFSIPIEAPTLAHRLAIEMLRARSKELHLSRIGPAGGAPEGCWTVLAYTAKAIIRLRLDQ